MFDLGRLRLTNKSYPEGWLFHFHLLYLYSFNRLTFYQRYAIIHILLYQKGYFYETNLSRIALYRYILAPVRGL